MAVKAPRNSAIRPAFRVILPVIVLLLVLCTCSAPSQPPAPSQGKAAEIAVEGEKQGTKPGVGFASRQKWIDHYQKHGREFGSISKEQYLRKAQELRDAPAGGNILEHVRGDGVVTRYNRATGEFIAFDADGVIRTYFRPNDGEAYFRRQALRYRSKPSVRGS